LFILSAWSGLGKGIKILSTTNRWIAAALVLTLCIVAPSVHILDMFTTSIGKYVENFFEMRFELRPNNAAKRDWINDCTICYWALLTSWEEFVDMFRARVSKGRTIKQFITGVLLAPTLVTFIFFAVFGGSALLVEKEGIAQLSDLATETVTFGMFENYPLGSILSFVTIFVIAVFFITSADSATFVIGMFSTNGQLNPANTVKVTWGLTLSYMAAIVMYFGGEIEGFENMLIISALPFSIIIIFMLLSFYKTIRKEKT